MADYKVTIAPPAQLVGDECNGQVFARSTYELVKERSLSRDRSSEIIEQYPGDLSAHCLVFPQGVPPEDPNPGHAVKVELGSGDVEHKPVAGGGELQVRVHAVFLDIHRHHAVPEIDVVKCRTNIAPVVVAQNHVLPAPDEVNLNPVEPFRQRCVYFRLRVAAVLEIKGLCPSAFFHCTTTSFRGTPR